MSQKKDHLTRGKACFPVQAFFRGWFIRFGERKLLFLDIRFASTSLQGFYGFGVLKKMMPVDSGQTLYQVIARSPPRKSQVVSKTAWIMIFPPFVRLGMMSMFTKPWFSDVIRNGTFTCELTSWESLVGQVLGTGHWSADQFFDPLGWRFWIVAIFSSKTVMKIGGISRGLQIGLVKQDHVCANW